MQSDSAFTGIFLDRSNISAVQEEEYGNTFPLFLRGMPPEHIHTTGKFHLVRVPEDMAGLKTYANAQWADQLNTVGAAYVNVQIMDWYSALNTNLVQGFMSHWLSVYSFGLVELLKYHSIVGESGLGMQSLCYLMNRDSFAELPADCQKIILDASKEWNAMALKEDDALTVQAGIDKAKELGNEVVYLTPEEQQQWQDFAKPIDEKWLAETEAAGYPQVREIYNDLKSMIAEY